MLGKLTQSLFWSTVVDMTTFRETLMFPNLVMKVTTWWQEPTLPLGRFLNFSLDDPCTPELTNRIKTPTRSVFGEYPFGPRDQCQPRQLRPHQTPCRRFGRNEEQIISSNIDGTSGQHHYTDVWWQIRKIQTLWRPFSYHDKNAARNDGIDENKPFSLPITEKCPTNFPQY